MNYDAQTVIAASLDIRLLLSSDTYRLLPALGEQIQVSSNLRLILTVPDQRKYMHTGYGSEPLVAEAASQLLRLEYAGNFVKAIEVADTLFGSYLSAKGDRGEFIARLLLTAAHDRAVRLQNQQHTSGTNAQLVYTKPVGLLDFLKCLFAKDHHSDLLCALPVEYRDGEVKLEEAFSSAYVHFTHFCRADKKDLCHLQFVWQGLVRSAAIQCCQTQEGVDIIIPIAFTSRGGRPEYAMLGKPSVSAIVIQVKDRIKPRPVHINLDKLNFFRDDKGVELNSRPFISIVLELGLVPEDVKTNKMFKATTTRDIGVESRASRQSKATYRHPQYNIVVNGFQGIYEGISKEEDAIMQKILSISSFDKEYTGSSMKSIYNFKSYISSDVGVVAVAD